MMEFINAVTRVATDSLSGAICEWANEPYWSVVEIRRARGRYPDVELLIWYDDERKDGHYEVYKASVQFRAIYDRFELVRDTVDAYRKLLNVYGPEEYLRQWDFPFPQAELEALSSWLQSQS